MAVSGTPNGGLDEIGESAYKNHAPYTLVAYINARNSLGLNSLTTDLVQPVVQNNYLQIPLNGVWSSISGDVTYVHSAANPRTGNFNPFWIASGPWSAPVTGVAIVFGNRIIHFYDITIGGVLTDFIPVNGSWLEVDLRTVV